MMDLSPAALLDNEVTIDASSFFGKVVITVPDNARVYNTARSFGHSHDNLAQSHRPMPAASHASMSLHNQMAGHDCPDPSQARTFSCMKPRITLLTLGVDDLERSPAFYRDGLGLQTNGIVGTEFEHGAVVFFDLNGGLKLALYPRQEIAHEAKVPIGPHSSTEFTIAAWNPQMLPED